MSVTTPNALSNHNQMNQIISDRRQWAALHHEQQQIEALVRTQQKLYNCYATLKQT